MAASGLILFAPWIAIAPAEAATHPTTIKQLEARLTADEQALKAVKSVQLNQLCSILQLHDEVSQLITEVTALEAGKPKPPPAAPTTVC
jgi:hypothetical protein